MALTVMAGLLPAIHVVPLACRPSANPVGSRQYLKLRLRLDDVDGRDKSPAMTELRASRFIRGGRPEAGKEPTTAPSSGPRARSAGVGFPVNFPVPGQDLL